VAKASLLRHTVTQFECRHGGKSWKVELRVPRSEIKSSERFDVFVTMNIHIEISIEGHHVIW
jgi:hypothetical protein